MKGAWNDTVVCLERNEVMNVVTTFTVVKSIVKDPAAWRRFGNMVTRVKNVLIWVMSVVKKVVIEASIAVGEKRSGITTGCRIGHKL